MPAPVATFSTEATTVTVDVAVEDAKGHFIPKIGQEYFRVSEDNVPQKIGSFSVGEAPMTIAMLVEFSNRYQSFYSQTWFQTLQAAYGFASFLKPDDYLAIVAYDLRPEMLTDFTTDRGQIQEALGRLRFPGSRSRISMTRSPTPSTACRALRAARRFCCSLPAWIRSANRLSIKARRHIQEGGVPIYAVGLMQSIRDMADARGALARNVRSWTSCKPTARCAPSRRKAAAWPSSRTSSPSIRRSSATWPLNLRSRYLITYTPSNQARDGKYRKIKVDLVDPSNNQPMRMEDDKRKPLKYTIYAKSGYTAPQRRRLTGPRGIDKTPRAKSRTESCGF